MILGRSMRRFFPDRASRRRLAVVLAAGMGMLAVAGCGRRDLYSVTGKVRFPDGSPVTTGRVVLDYGIGSKHGGWGYIKPDGTFTLGSLTQTDGVRAGTVRVAITFAYSLDPDPGSDPTAAKLKPLVHPRFETPETSGLAFEIPRQTQWDIVVERP
jgi:hypothetical protein